MRISTREILIGKYGHAAYKPCYWTEQSLRTGGRRQCYKHNFGIKSHQCIQSTSFRGCNIACSFCWRDVEGRQHSFQKLDEPQEIAEQLISEQSAIIEQHLPFALDNYENMIKVVYTLGSQGGTPLSIPEISERRNISRMRVKDALNDLRNADVIEDNHEKTFSLRKDLISEISTLDSARILVERLVASRKDIIDVHLEAATPKHIAISYDGEPTMYRRIGELISEFRKRNISTFVVTNGTFPERIKEIKGDGHSADPAVRHARSARQRIVHACLLVGKAVLSSERRSLGKIESDSFDAGDFEVQDRCQDHERPRRQHGKGGILSRDSFKSLNRVSSRSRDFQLAVTHPEFLNVSVRLISDTTIQI